LLATAAAPSQAAAIHPAGATGTTLSIGSAADLPI
jgi:hypothetical protein